VIDGIPHLVLDLSGAAHDELDHKYASDDGHDVHKTQQATYFNSVVAEEFEITRPHGTPRLYRFLMREKLRRGTQPIGTQLIGASVLTVCGGSGMEAEFLARAGAHVVTSDISFRAAQRTRERARRYGLAISPIVADVERLPFGDCAFDLVLVHDGLHHLPAPDVGLTEMARVARRWLSISEPSAAFATKVAVGMGLALDREDAGNVVARLTPAAVVRVLGHQGFEPVLAQRYAMYYRHRPGAIFHQLSRRWVFPLFRMAWALGNKGFGRFGNKMVVVAVRRGRAVNEATPSPGVIPERSGELSI
jgi:SAM-dependent methyltransferase